MLLGGDVKNDLESNNIDSINEDNSDNNSDDFSIYNEDICNDNDEHDQIEYPKYNKDLLYKRMIDCSKEYIFNEISRDVFSKEDYKYIV